MWNNLSTCSSLSLLKAKVTPDQWTSIPLPVKILGILADALLEIQEQILEDDNQDSDWQHRFLDSDWEEVEAGDTEIEQELIYSAGTTSYSRPSHGYLDAMAKAFNEDEDYGYDDDLLSTADSSTRLTWQVISLTSFASSLRETNLLPEEPPTKRNVRERGYREECQSDH